MEEIQEYVFDVVYRDLDGNFDCYRVYAEDEEHAEECFYRHYDINCSIEDIVCRGHA